MTMFDYIDNAPETLDKYKSLPDLSIFPVPTRRFMTTTVTELGYNLSRYIGPLYGDVIISKMHLGMK